MDALLLAVLNALWQAAALIALVALALRWGLRKNATTACVVWSVTFAVVALLPAVDLALARPAAVQPAQAQAAAARAAAAQADAFALHTAVESSAATRAVLDASTVADAQPQTRAVALPAPFGAAVLGRVGTETTRLGGVATTFVRTWGTALAGTWALVAALLLLRLGRAYAAIGAMKRNATPLDDPAVLARLRGAGHRRRATVACSSQVTIPCAVASCAR